MPKVFGEFLDVLPEVGDSVEITFTPTAHPVKQGWSTIRLSAQFMADYVSAFLPITENDPNRDSRIKETQGSIRYLANELLENAMKFKATTSKLPVKLGISLLEAQSGEDSEITVVLYVTNSLTREAAAKFQAFILKLLACDPEELYIRQVEQSLEQENSQASGLGFLTMINDYSAKLGWKFETVSIEPQIQTVTTIVQIKV